MNCAPTLTAEEFKQIHNAVCNLDSICDQLEAVLKPELYAKLAKARDNIRAGLKSAYEQDMKAYNRASEHYHEVRKKLDLTSIWSLTEVEDLYDRHPFGGVDRVIYKDHWGRNTVSVSVHGMTWVALWVAADACIRDSGDTHHVFIEHFSVSADDPRTLILSTGS